MKTIACPGKLHTFERRVPLARAGEMPSDAVNPRIEDGQAVWAETLTGIGYTFDAEPDHERERIEYPDGGELVDELDDDGEKTGGRVFVGKGEPVTVTLDVFVCDSCGTPIAVPR